MRDPLSPFVLEEITPIYTALSSDELLERCLGAGTQNNNESLNSCIWLIAPKHLQSRKNVIEIDTFLAVIIFNEGYQGMLKTMDTMGLAVGEHAETCAIELNSEKIDLSERRMSDRAKKARINQREEQLANRELLNGQ